MITKEQQEWIQAIVKWHRLTQEGQLKWQKERPPDTLAEETVDVVYTTYVKGRKLRLYEQHYKSKELGKLYKDLRPDIEWPTTTVLELIDSNDNVVWTIPQVEGLNDLLRAVKYQLAGVKDFLDEVRKDE